MEQLGLKDWQEKYQKARASYSKVLESLKVYESKYNGSRYIDKDANAKKSPNKKASVVRNIIYELTEAQIDSNLPKPKVSPLKKDKEWIAEKIEARLQNDLERLPFSELNDLTERMTYYLGGSFFHVEWNNEIHTRDTVGDVVLSELHPKQVIPQPGVYKIQDMDYIFILLARSKEYIEKVYGVELINFSEEDPDVRSNDDTTSEDLITQYICYYKNDDGGIGRFSWTYNQILEDYYDYQARQLERCVKCGQIKNGDVCSCGGKKFMSSVEEFEILDRDISVNGEIIPKGTKLPFYKPDVFPIVLRRNVTKYGSLLGGSDIDIINDQQEMIKMMQTKMKEKVIKGGSFISAGQKTKVKFDGEELNILRIDDPSEKAMLDVFNLQPSISADMQIMMEAYEEAKMALGVTDSFMGRKDSTATSGVAKQIAVQQSQGRLESKRIMKANAFSEIYEILTKFYVAYADEPRPIIHEDTEGHDVFSEFSKYDFLERDEAGVWYYNLDFLFSCDDSGSLTSNREAMWQETRMNFTSGCFGDVADINTQLTFWQFMADLHYPNANKVKSILEKKLQEQQNMQELQQQNAVLQGQLQGAEELNQGYQAQKDAETMALMQELEASQQASQPINPNVNTMQGSDFNGQM